MNIGRIAACKRNHIDPFAYPRDVLDHINAHPVHRIEELLSDNWLAARMTATA
ncbi:MAG: transposase domain-containing protein [bacterium]|nr:transposase domain-containing protein [bacterium]